MTGIRRPRGSIIPSFTLYMGIGSVVEWNTLPHPNSPRWGWSSLRSPRRRRQSSAWHFRSRIRNQTLTRNLPSTFRSCAHDLLENDGGLRSLLYYGTFRITDRIMFPPTRRGFLFTANRDQPSSVICTDSPINGMVTPFGRNIITNFSDLQFWI